jgi:mannose-1-phosphate guanylyltransferase
MKAFLLAAGYGTRLKPITDTIPKCLVPINDKPLLGWWIKLFQKHNISEVLINTHYLSHQVSDYIAGLNVPGMKIKVVYEPELLGSGGTVSNNLDFVNDQEDFLVCYADNLTCVDLSKLISFHQSHSEILTMGLFYTNNPSQCGIATLNEADIITQFVEKPQNPQSNLANAGIYVTNKEICNYFPEKTTFDFGNHVLPALINRMKGYVFSEYLLDIGTLANYRQASEEWNNDYI